MGRLPGQTKAWLRVLDGLDDLGFVGTRLATLLPSVLDGDAQYRIAVEARAALLPSLLGRVRRLLEGIIGHHEAQAVTRRRARREAVLQLPLPLAWA